jgi:ACS family tartrate transporter-like MFS transporter
MTSLPEPLRDLSMSTADASSPASPLDRARAKAYRRLLPILFACYVIAYIDRSNVAIAFDTMKTDLVGFDNDVLGTGFGIFFIGYFLLEIPGSLIVERWSASKWISRIMITWGIVAALTALVKVPWQFYTARFILGLAEAGFFPGVIVYLTHWFPSRDRARALAWFLIGTPIAMIASPLLSYPLLKIGTSETIDGVTRVIPPFLGLAGWQWVYIAWGIPAVVLGLIVLFYLTDRPHKARWLDQDEREALEAELEREKAERKGSRHMGWAEALKHPKVLLLAAAYFFIVTGNYGVESFLPTILKKWYGLSKDQLQYILIAPAAGSLLGQLFVGRNSDRTKERRLHASVPIYIGATALGLTLVAQHPLPLMIGLFTIAAAGLKAYLPAFWTLPSIFLTEAAAAGSIGLINSVGNLGGFVGPKVLGLVEKKTGLFWPGIVFLCISMAVSATIIVCLGLGKRDGKPATVGSPMADPTHDLPGATEHAVP